MSFPNIQYKITQVEIEPAIKALVEQKFSSLSKFIGNETDVKCEVEFEKVAPKNNGEVHRFETNLWISGTLYRAESTEESFEKAIDVVRNELDKEIRRSRTKRESLFRKGGRKIKNMMRFGK
ncbi:ribosome-associated translation inhibitor RaiA [Candidatus Kaiserbacteria bacterium]|nr:ribosome-associated translation inhibitor RaiA [Candidatus Kaiserbacteria bacterium]